MPLDDRYANQPFPEAISYLRGKISLDTNKWDDILDAEHDAAFVVAGAKGALLTDLRGAVEKAIANGQRPEEFLKEFERISEGWAHAGDKAWRANILYQTNLDQSYAAGRYTYQLDPEVLKLQPYLQWIHGDSARPRPAHLALDRKVFQANSLPFYPPNGYRCKCRTISLSQGQLQRQGLSVETLQRGDLIDYTDERGVPRQVLLNPDKGFDRIPGRGDRRALLEGMIARFPTEVAAPLRAELARIDAEMAAAKAAKKTSTRKKKAPETSAIAPFPASLDELKEVRKLGGSTGATLVQDAQGNLFVMKRGNTAAHLLEEVNADSAYQSLGLNVPRFKQYKDAAGKPVKLAEFIEGQPLGALRGEALEAARAELRKDFAADALLGNWDVVGLSEDNVLVDNAGRVWRIDNGGALRYRAQGAAKGAAWNNYPTELWTLRDAAKNANTAAAFADLDYYDLAEQMRGLVAKEKELLKSLPKALHPAIKGRLAEMKRLVGISDTFKADAWKSAYTSNFSRHATNLRASGLIDQLPTQLRQVGGKGVAVVDEAGKAFDNFRGAGSHLEKLRDYIGAQGGDYRLISSWMKAQGSSSWSEESQLLKNFMAGNRTKPSNVYYWRDGADKAKQISDRLLPLMGGERTYSESMTAWHAFNYEILDRMKLSKKTAAGTIRLVRTENKAVMVANNLSPGATGAKMTRGAIESTSIYQKVSVYGSEVTEQEVPLHRIFGTYFTEKYPGAGGSGFLGDNENEFVAMLEDLPFNYKKSGRTKSEDALYATLLGDEDDLDILVDDLLSTPVTPAKAKKKEKPKMSKEEEEMYKALFG